MAMTALNPPTEMGWLLVTIAALCVYCSSAEDLPWWKTTTLYQVYPRSFKDSDGDGVGDIKGITQMADHFKDIGVGAIWISPIYRSPMADMGYDVTDFMDVDPMFGTMQDFEALLAKFKELGVKVLMDMVPNHTSDEHPWFQASRDPSHPLHDDYKDFYVWKDPIGRNDSVPIPPSNWISVFDGSAWEWSQERKQFYLHQFLVKQPDLNYRNSLVVGNMTRVLNFWMDKGVDGFRVDAPKFMFEDDNCRDDIPVPGTKGDTNDNLIHIHTENQPETFDLLKYWADLVYERNVKENTERSLWLEVYDPFDILMSYYGTGNRSLQVPFNFFIISIGQSSRAPAFKALVEHWINGMPSGGTPNWVTGNHDVTRVSDNFGPEMVDVICMLTGTLPGVKVTYYGEEIGMTNTFMRPDQIKDQSFRGRDPFRSPMQWDNSPNAGFSTNSSTWLPINPNYWWLNVEAQLNSPGPSHLKVYREISTVRKDPVLQRGDLNIVTPDNDTMIVVRYYNDTYYVLVINFGTQSQLYTSVDTFTPSRLDLDMEVVVGSSNSGHTKGTALKKRSISLYLRPKSAVLLRSTDSSPSPSSAPSTSGALTLVLISSLLTVYNFYHQ